jgi:hypothetical protein
MSHIVEDICLKVSRPQEAIKDRIKKYIKDLDPEDEQMLSHANKHNPNYYVHWRSEANGKKRIDCIVQEQPGLNQSRREGGNSN